MGIFVVDLLVLGICFGGLSRRGKQCLQLALLEDVYHIKVLGVARLLDCIFSRLSVAPKS